MPSIRKIAKAPCVPYFVTKYPETWDTLSVPESWLTVTTTMAGLTATQLRDERSEQYIMQVEEYKRASRIWDRIQRDRADAKAAKEAVVVAADAAHRAFINSPEEVAKRAARKALFNSPEEVAKRDAYVAAHNAVLAARAAAAEAARPTTARELRVIARAAVAARQARENSVAK